MNQHQLLCRGHVHGNDNKDEMDKEVGAQSRPTASGIDGTTYTTGVFDQNQDDTFLPHDERFSEAPYDLYCPSVQSQLANRICETCGLYFASVKSVTSHRKIHRRSGVGERAQEKIIPTRILSRRENFGENEVLCLHDNYGTGVDVVEWFVEEDVDTCSVTISPDLENPALPVIQNLVDWMRSPWSDEIF
ncbi:hypothetical protein QAD02_003771 [Eretmocerus hayati]|uniref:Uncharacterized protein n=1 Tax=Eretmocerus hayati TaxID=131215 RepID=A0ACC2NN26_9HYME|nr:hypothetical protein QAD02_003771 [Eretmocerus hayati]